MWTKTHAAANTGHFQRKTSTKPKAQRTSSSPPRPPQWQKTKVTVEILEKPFANNTGRLGGRGEKNLTERRTNKNTYTNVILNREGKGTTEGGIHTTTTPKDNGKWKV